MIKDLIKVIIENKKGERVIEKNIEKIKKVIYSNFSQSISYLDIEYKMQKEYIYRQKKIGENYKVIMQNMKLEKKLNKIFEQYCVVDWTDYDDLKCLEYKILMHKNQKILDDDIELMEELHCSRKDMVLFISLLEKYYYYYFQETTYSFVEKRWTFNEINMFNISEVNDMEKYMNQNGYNRLDKFGSGKY